MIAMSEPGVCYCCRAACRSKTLKALRGQPPEPAFRYAHLGCCTGRLSWCGAFAWLSCSAAATILGRSVQLLSRDQPPATVFACCSTNELPVAPHCLQPEPANHVCLPSGAQAAARCEEHHAPAPGRGKAGCNAQQQLSSATWLLAALPCLRCCCCCVLMASWSCGTALPAAVCTGITQ